MASEKTYAEQLLASATGTASTRMATSDSCNSSYQSSGSMPKETESTSSELTVSLLDRLKAPMRSSSELSRNFRWPEDALLYCLPPERELLTDRARRFVFESYLQLAGLSYTSRVAPNVDCMSPSGTAPFLCLKMGPQPLIFSDFEKMVSFLETQHIGLTVDLEPKEKANQEAFISLIRTKIIPTEEYYQWANTKNFNEYSAPVHGYGLPWPLSSVIPRIKQVRYCWHHWEMFRRQQDEVVLEFEQACSTLSERLDKSKTFFSAGPTTLDVMVYGHMHALMTTDLPSNDLATVALRFKNLGDFCRTTVPGMTVSQAHITSS